MTVQDLLGELDVTPRRHAAALDPSFTGAFAGNVDRVPESFDREKGGMAGGKE
jgi:sulfur carrier protein ThiS